MGPKQRKVSKYIRSLESRVAADWLLEKYNKAHNERYGEVYDIIPHRSWKRRDQIRLADYYLSNLPHASGRGYKAFLSFMSVPVFIDVIKRHLPDKADYDLLVYYLYPALMKHAKSDKDVALIEEFINELR